MMNNVIAITILIISLGIILPEGASRLRMVRA